MKPDILFSIFKFIEVAQHSSAFMIHISALVRNPFHSVDSLDVHCRDKDFHIFY